MTAAVAPALADCPHCGTLQRRPDDPQATTLACVTCHTVLERTAGRSLEAALACSGAAFLLLFPANLGWFLNTSVAGVSRTSWLVSSPIAMLQDGWPALALAIFLFAVALPFVRFGLLTWVLAMLKLGRRPGGLGRAFRYANALQVWAMPDVFLLGLLVAFARLKASIAVELGVGAYAFIAVGVLALLTRASLDKAAVWRAIAADRAPSHGGSGLVCTACEQVLPVAYAHCGCPRCGALVRVRRPEAVGRAAALSLAALLFYIPANLLPLATLPIGVTPTRYTVLQGVIDLLQAHLLGLALLVFTASFAIPIVKLLGLSWCVGSVVRRSDRRLRAKTRMFQVVEEIGRWSMVDPFVIACFVPVMQYNTLIYGRAEAAAPPFAAVVILTMLATRCFDPRLMWDAARHRRSPA